MYVCMYASISNVYVLMCMYFLMCMYVCINVYVGR